jgi:2-haloacid dehalogenase
MSSSFSLDAIQALTFDLFGTVLDLGGSLTPYIDAFLKEKKSTASAKDVWHEWRYRQRLEQFQDNIVAMGHSGYTPVARRAAVFVLKQFGVDASPAEVDRLMEAWQHLKPFPEVVAALARLKKRFRLVALSNGERSFLAHLVKNQIQWDFDDVISVEEVGAFKPHPGVYRRGAFKLGLEIGQCMMVSANSFDVMGARMCGMRGAYVNRYNLPYEDTPFVADVTVKNFTELADKLLA